MSTSRAREKARTRARYLTEAARLFAERGFHAVSIEALGEAVGVSGPALYRHFAGKEAMLEEILIGTSERLLEGAEEILAQPDQTARAQLVRLIDFHVDFALSAREVIRLQDRDLAALAEASNRTVRRLQRRYIDAWAGVVAKVQPDLSPAERQVLMHAVFGILNSTAHTSTAVASERVTRETLTRAAQRVVLPDG